MKDPSKFPLKVKQLGAYIYMLKKTGRYDKNWGRLLIFHYNLKKLRAWRIEFSDEELEKIWSDLKWHQKILENALKLKVPPHPDPYSQRECEFCPYRGRCWGESGRRV